jgi:arylsulfatase A-like enzyme
MGQPNLIFVFADQLSRNRLGYAGDQWARTPNLDDFAAAGVDCCNAVSGSPVCAPFRASLFTGKYQSSTGMVINTIRMNPDHECFAHALNAGGYETAYIGKWHLWGTKRGNYYDTDYSYCPPGPHRLGFDDFYAGYNFLHNYYVAFYHTDSPRQIPVHGFEPDFQTDMAIKQIKRMKEGDKPFATFLSFGTPHDPWARVNTPEDFYKTFEWTDFDKDPPPNFMSPHDGHHSAWTSAGDDYPDHFKDIRTSYYAMTANLDWNMGRLFDALDEMGLRDDTIVVFTSDHGEMFGAHSRVAKCTFYEESVRTPFLMQWGDRLPAGANDVCINTPDIMPTLLGMMDLPIPAGVEGVDLSTRLLTSDGPEPDAAFMQGLGEVDGWTDGCEWRALRDKQYTYAVYREPKDEMLFDNITDPYQLTNLIDSPEHVSVTEAFRAQMHTKMTDLNDTFEPSTYYRDNWLDADSNILRTATLNA